MPSRKARKPRSAAPPQHLADAAGFLDAICDGAAILDVDADGALALIACSDSLRKRFGIESNVELAA